MMRKASGACALLQLPLGAKHSPGSRRIAAAYANAAEILIHLRAGQCSWRRMQSKVRRLRGNCSPSLFKTDPEPQQSGQPERSQRFLSSARKSSFVFVGLARQRSPKSIEQKLAESNAKNQSIDQLRLLSIINFGDLLVCHLEVNRRAPLLLRQRQPN